MERRIEGPDRHRETVHRFEDSVEIRLLKRFERIQRRRPLRVRAGQDHLAHHRQAARREEHVLGSAEPDALGAERPGARRVLRRVSVRPHLEPTLAIGPFEQRFDLGAVQIGLTHPGRAENHPTGCSVDGDRVRRRQFASVDRQGSPFDVDFEFRAPGHRGLAHPARDDRGVTRHAAACRQHARRRVDAGKVIGRRFGTNEDHRHTDARLVDGFFRGEDRASGYRARAGRQSPRNHLDRLTIVDSRVQKSLDLVRLHPADGGRRIDQSLLDKIDGDPGGSTGRPLACARLEHVQRAALDREFEILHVLVVRFKLFGDIEKIVVGTRQRLVLAHFCDGERRANARDDVFALRIDQIFTEQARRAGRRVASKCNARRAGFAEIAENHRLHIGSSAKVVRNAFGFAVGHGALRVPRSEHGENCQSQLLPRIVREFETVRRIDRQRLLDHVAHLIDRQFVIVLNPGRSTRVGHDLFEWLVGNAEGNMTKHVQQPAERVEYETLSGHLPEPFDRFLGETEIENRIHHAGHRELRTRTHRNKQRLIDVAELPAGRFTDGVQGASDFVPQGIGSLAPMFEITAARFGCHGKARWHRQPEPGHFRKIRTFATKQIAIRGGSFREPSHPQRHIELTPPGQTPLSSETALQQQNQYITDCRPLSRSAPHRPVSALSPDSVHSYRASGRCAQSSGRSARVANAQRVHPRTICEGREPAKNPLPVQKG